MNNSASSWLFPIQNDHLAHAAHWIPSHRLGQLRVVETDGAERQAITELIVQLALRGPYNLIAVDEWLPDRDTLMRSIHRHTLKIRETLDSPIIKRPMTCLQLKDLLTDANIQKRPTLILNFLYHFYNADVELSLRNRILRQCCQYAESLSLYAPVVIVVPRLFTEDYDRFFPFLAEIADEVVPIAEWSLMEASQGSLF